MIVVEFELSGEVLAAVIDYVAVGYADNRRQLEQPDAFIPHPEPSAVDICILVLEGSFSVFFDRFFLLYFVDDLFIVEDNVDKRVGLGVYNGKARLENCPERH